MRIWRPALPLSILRLALCAALAVPLFPAAFSQTSSPASFPAQSAPQTRVAAKPPARDRKAAAAEKVRRAAFARRADAIFAEARAERGHWGLLVVDAASGETLYAHNPDKFFTPASNTKLWTTVTVLALVGPRFKYHTTLETSGRIETSGRLMGDLVLVAHGDPNLSNRKFPYAVKVEREGPPERVLITMADAIVARGIRQISGDLIVDDSFFVYERYPSGWAIDDMTFGYGAPVSALCLNDNTMNIEVRPAEREGNQALLNIEPWAEFYEFENRVTTTAAVSGLPREAANNAPGGVRILLDREPGSRRVVLRGRIPLGAEPRTLSLALEEPAEFTAALLKRLLEQRGVRVLGRARARHSEAAGQAEPGSGNSAPAGTNAMPLVLAEHISVPLLDAVGLVNKISQNLHAELLLRLLSKEMGTAKDGSVDDGLRRAREFWQSIGIAENEVAIYDGSGLSRRNLITPRATVKLLQYAATQPWAADFAATLPVAGADGTLDTRMKDTAAALRIRAKTGTLGNVNALSGYAETLGGRKLIFSMFGNSHGLRGRDSTAVLDALCVAMVEELGSPQSAAASAKKK